MKIKYFVSFSHHEHIVALKIFKDYKLIKSNTFNSMQWWKKQLQRTFN